MLFTHFKLAFSLVKWLAESALDLEVLGAIPAPSQLFSSEPAMLK